MTASPPAADADVVKAPLTTSSSVNTSSENPTETDDAIAATESVPTTASIPAVALEAQTVDSPPVLVEPTPVVLKGGLKIRPLKPAPFLEGSVGASAASVLTSVSVIVQQSGGSSNGDDGAVICEVNGHGSGSLAVSSSNMLREEVTKVKVPHEESPSQSLARRRAASIARMQAAVRGGEVGELEQALAEGRRARLEGTLSVAAAAALASSTDGGAGGAGSAAAAVAGGRWAAAELRDCCLALREALELRDERRRCGKRRLEVFPLFMSS